jgi:hypothetical protein
MANEAPEVIAARTVTHEVASMLERAPSFRQLDATTRDGIVRDLAAIRGALTHPDSTTRDAGRARPADPYAFALETPNDLLRRRAEARLGASAPASGDAGAAQTAAPAAPTSTPKPPATEAIASRAGALSDEINFPEFVANLIHGTFDALVDASIRQMEAFAELVSAVAKDVDRFTSENVTPNQVRDYLAQQHPRDLALDVPLRPGEGEPRLRRRESTETTAPTWLADYGLAGEELTDDLIEDQIVPAARRKVGENRLQTLATMVLMGMNRIVIKDGSISAKLRFRAAARDSSSVQFAQSHDPGAPGPGSRGSLATVGSTMMVSTVGVNVQADADLKTELFGEVRINFASETLPLEHFVDAAQMALLRGHAKTPASAPAAAAVAPAATPAPAPSTPDGGGAA